MFNAQSVMRRADGALTAATWEAAAIDNPSIRPGETRVAEYATTIPSGLTGELTVDVALRFRSFSPASLRELNLDHLLPVPIMEMAEASARVQLQ